MKKRFPATLPLVLLAAACSPKEEPGALPQGADPAPPAASGSAAPPVPEPVPAAPVFEGPGEKLVRGLDGWKLAGAPRYFGPDNLYDLIDGGAEVYVQFGFVRMVTAEYRDAGRPGVAVTVEIYDMGSPKGAFGRAARFLEGRVDPSGAGKGLPAAFADRGQLGDGDLVVWQDRYLVHATVIDERPDATPEGIAAAGAGLLPAFASAVLARIGGETAPPAALASFPAKGRVPRGEAWHPGRLLDVEGLGAGYTVRYADGTRSWVAFATEELAGPEAAETAWRSVKGATADGRCLAINAVGSRIVGIVQDGDARLDDALVEREAAALRKAFARP